MSPSNKWEPLGLSGCKVYLTSSLNRIMGRSGLQGSRSDICGIFWGTGECQRLSLGHQTKHLAVERSEGLAGSWPASHKTYVARVGGKQPEVLSKAFVRRTTHEMFWNHRAVLFSMQVVTKLEMTPWRMEIVLEVWDKNWFSFKIYSWHQDIFLILGSIE